MNKDTLFFILGFLSCGIVALFYKVLQLKETIENLVDDMEEEECDTDE